MRQNILSNDNKSVLGSQDIFVLMSRLFDNVVFGLVRNVLKMRDFGKPVRVGSGCCRTKLARGAKRIGAGDLLFEDSVELVAASACSCIKRGICLACRDRHPVLEVCRILDGVGVRTDRRGNLNSGSGRTV